MTSSKEQTKLGIDNVRRINLSNSTVQLEEDDQKMLNIFPPRKNYEDILSPNEPKNDFGIDSS